MTKPELLSPAGNIDSLKAAIHNGADAVYLSGKSFGARAYAENFSNEEIKEAIKYAHTYNVKVYVTANTIIYENEIDEFVEYIKFLYLNGVDAVLMQDIGMIDLIRNIIPDLEIHASTQTHNTNDETLKLFKDLGVKRVVLARELTLPQIQNLKTDIEKEVFIHGALCICYSGCCLFSSLNGGRSGNRGKCAGPCRLPYTLIKNDKPLKTNGKYLLSTRELNTSKKIKELINSNIQSLKIEGRLKSPEYVGFITNMYRKLIDDNQIDDNAEKELKSLFNREFTDGHLFQTKTLMNATSPNHIGIEIGKVISTKNKIKIKLTQPLSQNDGIRFKESNQGMIINKLYNEKGLLINKANENDIIFLDNKLDLKTNDTVLKTTNYLLNEKLKNYQEKKLNINFIVEAYINKPLKITVQENDITTFQYGSIITEAINNPTTKENIIEKLSKLGNTPFVIENITIKKDDNIFIRASELNELRRSLTDEIIKIKTKVDRKLPNKIYDIKKQTKSSKINITASVYTEKQFLTLQNEVDKIYTNNYELYKKYKNKNLYFKPSRTQYALTHFEKENLLISNLGHLEKYQNNNCQSDYYLNIVNSYSINFLNNHQIKTVTLSPELNISQISDIMKKATNTEVIVYGTLELMIMNHCIIKENDKCPNCKENNYYLKNHKNELFPIITQNCQTIILQHNKTNLIGNINELLNMNVTNFRLEFFDENEKEILNIINQIKKELTK